MFKKPISLCKSHVILARKLYRLQVQVFIIQWIMSFLSDRTQATKLGFHLSTQLSINRSIVQGIHPSIHVYFSEKSNQKYGTYISTSKYFYLKALALDQYSS